MKGPVRIAFAVLLLSTALTPLPSAAQGNPRATLQQLDQLVRSTEQRYGPYDPRLVDLLRARADALVTLYTPNNLAPLEPAKADLRRVLEVLRHNPGPAANAAAASTHTKLGLLALMSNSPWIAAREEFEAGVALERAGTIPHLISLSAFGGMACQMYDSARCQSVAVEVQREAQRLGQLSDENAIVLADVTAQAASQRGDVPALLDVAREMLRRMQNLGARVNEEQVRMAQNAIRELGNMGYSAEAKDLIQKLLAAIDARGVDPRSSTPSWLDAVSMAWGNAALTLATVNDAQTARILAQRTLALAGQVKVGSGVVFAELALAEALEQIGDLAGAENLFSQHIATGGACAHVYGRLSFIRARRGDANGATAVMDQGVSRVDRIAFCENTDWMYFADAARSLEGLGDSSTAIAMGKIAIERTEAIRRRFDQGRTEDLRAFSSSRADIYYDVSGWLTEQGRFDEAESVLRLLRQSQLEEFVRGNTNGPAPQGPILRNGEVPFRDQIRAGAPIRTARENLNPQAAAPPVVISHESGAVRPGDVRLRLTPAPGNAGYLAVISTSAGSQPAIRIALRPTTLSSMLTRFTERTATRLTGGSASTLPLADLQMMYRDLWQPLQMQVDKRLGPQGQVVLWLDGPAARVPFGALHDGEHYLVERYVFVRETLRPVARGSSLGGRLAGFATNRSTSTLPPLKNATSEVRDLVERLGGSKAGHQAFLESQYDRRTLLQVGSTGTYSRLHIAGHFVYPMTSTQTGYLLLGDGTALYATEFKELSLRNVDLIMLSSCETARPLPPNGAGDASMSSAAELLRAAGARQVVASLWQVDDRVAPRLVQGFYDALGAGGGDAASALATVQRAVLRDTRNVAARDPFLWASFVAFTAPEPGPTN